MSTPSDEIGGVSELVVGQRYQQQIDLASPGVGKDWILRVPGGVRWRLVSLQIGYASDATTGNRMLELEFIRGSTPYVLCPVGVQQGPSQNLFYCWFVGAALVTTVTPGIAHTAPVPSCWLDAGWAFYLPIPGTYVHDYWSGATVWVEEERIGPPAPREVVRAVPLVE
jgi:hypothetical protein